MTQEELQKYFNVPIREVGKPPIGEEADDFTNKIDTLYSTYKLSADTIYHTDMQNSLDDEHLQEMAKLKHLNNLTKVDQWYEGLKLKRQIINDAFENGDISEKEKDMVLTKIYSKSQTPINMRDLDISPQQRTATPMEKAVQAYQAHKQIEALEIPEEDKRAMRKAAGLPEPKDVESDFIKASTDYEKALDSFNTQWKLRGDKVYRWNTHSKSYKPATEQERKEYSIEEGNLKRLSERVDKFTGKLSGTDVTSQQKAKIALSVAPTIELQEIWPKLNDAAKEQAFKMFYSGKSVAEIKQELSTSTSKILKEE